MRHHAVGAHDAAQQALRSMFPSLSADGLILELLGQVFCELLPPGWELVRYGWTPEVEDKGHGVAGPT
jgi:hypothetical protein